MAAIEALVTTPHEPTERCAGVHCHWHHVDEVANRAYIGCPECGHLYRTAGALRRAYRRQHNHLLRHDWPHATWRKRRRAVISQAGVDVFGLAEALSPTRSTLLWIWVRSRFIRARDIHFCQECIHDF